MHIMGLLGVQRKLVMHGNSMVIQMHLSVENLGVRLFNLQLCRSTLVIQDQSDHGASKELVNP